MNKTDQNSIPAEMIRQWTDKPIARLNSFGSGLYNSVYRFELEKNEYILRIAPFDETPKLFYEVDMMHSEPAIHKLTQKQTNIPVPTVVYHDFSRNDFDRDYLIMEKLPGTVGGYNLKELGRYVSELHGIKQKEGKFGYPCRRFDMGDRWGDVFLDYAHRIFHDCRSAGAVTGEEHDYFTSIYLAYESVFADCDPCLLHLDLWRTNILTENGRITGILDFDRGLYGDKELEFAVLDTYSSATEEFFEGYGQPRPDSDDAEIRRVLYLVYELIKYAFIRLIRGGSESIAAEHVRQCKSLMKSID